MATLRSTVAGTSFLPVSRPQGALHGYGFSYAVASNPAANDILILGKVPKDCTLLAFWIDISRLDTHASATLSASVGDQTTAALFLATQTTMDAARSIISSMAITSGQTLGTIAGTLPKRYTINGDLRMTFTATAATFAAGAIRGWYIYSDHPKYRDPGQ